MSIYAAYENASTATSIADADQMYLLQGTPPAVKVVPGSTLKAEANNGLVTNTTATLTVTAALHAGKVVVLNRAAGIAVTLPAAAGTGNVYRFINQTTISSNSTTIKVANASDAFIGFSNVISDDAGGPAKGFIASAGTDDTITLNGTTTGGYAGDYVEIRDIATNVFSVQVYGKATGTEATPFSATV